ncbi:MAG: sulfurtransferase [Acidimicrobiia bacterium]
MSSQAGVPPIVDAAWWQRRQPDLVTIDVRWYLDGRSGRDAYAAGHVPGAVFVDLDRWLAAPVGDPREGRHPLPSPEVFAEGMAQAGVGDDDVVVAYDDAGGVVAARLVWLLRATGHAAALLDGGISAFPGALDRSPVTTTRASFAPRAWPAHLIANCDDATSPSNVVLDARDRNRFTGEVEPVDPRAGHIPGARSLPCRENLDADARFVPVHALRQRFLDVGVVDGHAVVSYCGSGVNACHTLLALEHAGLGQGRLYPGSWSAYSNTDLPVATGNGRTS